MKELYYEVGSHVFSLQMGEQESVVCGLRNYEPFAVSPREDIVFSLRIADSPLPDEGVTEEMRQQDEGQEIVVGHQATGEPAGTNRSRVAPRLPARCGGCPAMLPDV